MRISTKGRYAIILMLDLAIHNNGEYISINNIAERQKISSKYLEQIISVICKAGLVSSVRGPQGGYRLTKKPSEYTVGMILRLMEGSLEPIDYIDGVLYNDAVPSERQTRFVWERLGDAINSVVDSITLEDIINKEKENYGYDYCI